MQVPGPQTVEMITSLFESLDYGTLGSIYCDEGGEAFWEDRRGPVVESGLAWGAALGRRLSPGGKSLYVGAGVAELPALVTEALDLQRTLRIANLRTTECESLNQSLAASGLEDRIRFTPGGIETHGGAGPFDHVAVVSVLDDPETWPQVSGVTYGRIPPVLLDVAAFAEERKKVQKLVGDIFDVLSIPCVVTTTVEEVPWFLHEAESRHLQVEADDETVETALVGDPIGFLRVTAHQEKA
jgi:hypothetical protein